MKNLISISTIGNIKVLDIPFLCSMDYIKDKFKGYNLEEHPKTIVVKDFRFENLPMFDISFHFNKENKVKSFCISNYHFSRKNCDCLYDFFKSILNNLNVVSEKKGESYTELVLSNHLHKVLLLKQIGLGDNCNEFPLVMTIYARLVDAESTLFSYSEESRDEAIKDLYFYKDYDVKPIINNDKSYKLILGIKIVFILLLLYIAYLFVLNGRYAKIDDNYFFDKWDKKGFVIENFDDIR